VHAPDRRWRGEAVGRWAGLTSSSGLHLDTVDGPARPRRTRATSARPLDQQREAIHAAHDHPGPRRSASPSIMRARQISPCT
jgi:hypothetical protein